MAREYTWPRQVKRTRIMLEALAGDPLALLWNLLLRLGKRMLQPRNNRIEVAPEHVQTQGEHREDDCAAERVIPA